MNSDVFQMVITLLGGLALFIYGMNLMSDGLQKAAGEKMEKVLALLTKNPILGVLAGTVCTAVLQQRNNSNGAGLCKRGFDEAASGN